MRLTRKKDEFECRVGTGDCCDMEEWVEKITGVDVHVWSTDDFCSTCPFEKYINKLAEYEDKAEEMEDDLK